MGTKIMQNSSLNQHGRGFSHRDTLDTTVLRQASRGDRSEISSLSETQTTDRSTTVVRVGIGLASVLSEHVLSHPYIVLRRQCQVNHDSQWYHLTPFTLFQTILNIQRHQSVTTLWKGIGSTLMVKGITVCTESAISEFTPFPKEISRHSPLKKIVEHLMLKGLSFVVVTPFYASSLVETVQSEIASERPGVFDCLKEGFSRIMSLSVPPATRLLPVWKLFFPTMVHGVLHYVISSLARYTVILSMKSEMMDSKLHQTNDLSQTQQSAYSSFYPELLATFTGSLLADIMLYPLETVLHRLCMQGTRTIIDNTDSGLGVIPIITRYEGALDCLRSIIAEEGISGLYKGFGALVLQYLMHVAVLRFTKFILDTFSNRDNPKPILASDLVQQQQQQRKNSERETLQSDYHMYRGDFSRSQRGDISNVSFNLDSSYATSTPYDTPQSYMRSAPRFQGDTGTGSAKPQ